MKAWAIRSVLWGAIIGGLLLPPLSVNGFVVGSLEYIIVAAVSFLIGTLIGSVTKFRILNGILILITLVLFCSIYLASPILWANYLWVPYAIATTIGLFTYVAVVFPHQLLSILAAGAGMYVISSAILAQPLQIKVMQSNPLTYPINKNASPVLHVLLDEHIGMAAIPDEVMTESERYAFIKPYLDRGFLVFTHAYSADLLTHLSIARIFNPSLHDTTQALKQNDRSAYLDLLQAGALHTIAKNRDINWYGLDRLNLIPAIQKLKTNLSIENLNTNHIGSISSRKSLDLSDRLLLSTGLILHWLDTNFKSPLVVIVKNHVGFLSGYYKNATPLSKLDFLDAALIASSNLPNSNWYTFIHALIPHIPFVYNEDCSLRPVLGWVTANRLYDIADVSTPLKRYFAHIKQAKCATTTFIKGLDYFRHRSDFEEMTVIVHGDHGSRIQLWSIHYTEPTNRLLKLDAYATFLAVRLPKTERGQVIDTPVRIDDVFNLLLKNDFKQLDIAKLPKRTDPFYTGR